MKIAATPPPGHTSPLQKAAIQLEAAFLAELLKSAGVGESRDSFGGGIGEDQFASFLRQQHAGSLAQAGAIGLAESIFNALKERPDG
ncbi:MAG: rod-binding protein [Paracoccaceae bacterium]